VDDRTPGLWHNGAFVRFWTSRSVSIFGSYITRMALPFVAILVLGAGAIEVAILRSIDLAVVLVFGLFAGAWVDRLRRRPRCWAPSRLPTSSTSWTLGSSCWSRVPRPS
jgi:hypothetical protein